MAEGFDDLAAELERGAAPMVPAPQALANLLKAARLKRIEKGDHLCRQGDPVASLYFVRSGLLRYYYLADGTEHTGQFFNSGVFVADVFALTTGAPALQYIDALEASEIVTIPRLALLAAYDADHALERFGRCVIEQAMVGAQRRSASLLLMSPAERYDRLIRTRGKVASRVPLYIVASYLGITPEALSRIRRRRIEK